MSEDDTTNLKIENLVLKLNHMAQQRMGLHDQIWALEQEGEKLRLELVALITDACKKSTLQNRG